MSKKVYVLDLFQKSGAIKFGHFVYKGGTHSGVYYDKESLANLSPIEVVLLIETIGKNALQNGLELGRSSKRIGILGPAMGATPYPLTLASYFQRTRPNYSFFYARTELTQDKHGRRIHIIPEKLRELYQQMRFIILEDVINNGTTVREVKNLLEKQFSAEIIAVLCLIDRGSQTEESLSVRQYFPLERRYEPQYSPANCPFCVNGTPINLNYGKGKIWVDLFGQPPYPREIDFSSFNKI